MKREQLSLMTFSMDIDIVMKIMSVADCLTMAKAEGIPYVDVMNLPENRLQEYMAAVKKIGVRPYCYIGVVSFFSNKDNKIQEMIKKHLQDAAKLGAKLYMIVPINAQKDENICTKLGKAEVRRRLITYFAMAVRLAEGSGIRVCFETIPQDYSCLSGTEDCRWILEQVPNLGLVYDTANMLPHGDDPLEYYEALKQHIVHVHVKDVVLAKSTWKDKLFHAEKTKNGQVMKCCMSGMGVIPIKEILHHMEADCYQGVYALEYSHPEKYPANYAQNAEQLKKHIAFCIS